MNEGMRLTRRTVMDAFGTASAAGVLAACGAGGAAEPQGTQGSKMQAPVNLRYVASFRPSSQTTWAGGASKLVELWNEKATPIKVEPIAPTNNRNEAVLSMITAGDPPDLFHALPRDYHPFANLSALLELDPYLKKDKRAQDVIPTILEYWARGDKHYAMPNNWSPQAIYFNKTDRLARHRRCHLRRPRRYGDYDYRCGRHACAHHV